MIVGAGPKAQKSVECAKALLEDSRVQQMINELNGAKVCVFDTLLAISHPPPLSAQETVLHCACRNTNIDAIPLLLKHGADMDALDQNSRTPLQTLAIKGTRTCLAYHLKRSFLILYNSIQGNYDTSCGQQRAGCQFWLVLVPNRP